VADSGITIGRFTELLNTYGSDFARWPSAEADAARLLLTRSKEAQDAYAEADALDAMFAHDKSEKAPPGLLDKIMSAIDKPGKK
jgi:hypothetical protein